MAVDNICYDLKALCAQLNDQNETKRTDARAKLAMAISLIAMVVFGIVGIANGDPTLILLGVGAGWSLHYFSELHTICTNIASRALTLLNSESPYTRAFYNTYPFKLFQ